MNGETTHYDERCPNCGRFVPRDQDEFYATDYDRGELGVFCHERCAIEYEDKWTMTDPETVKYYEELMK